MTDYAYNPFTDELDIVGGAGTPWVGITLIEDNGDGTLTITYWDWSTMVTGNLKWANWTDGDDGTDWREIELQKWTTHIQRRYVWVATWTDLVALVDLQWDKWDKWDKWDDGEVWLLKTTSITTSATPTPDMDTTDLYIITALADAATIWAPTWTIAQWRKLFIRIKDAGVAKTLAWNAIYRVIWTTLPTTTVIGKTIYVWAVYNLDDSKRDVLAVSTEV